MYTTLNKRFQEYNPLSIVYNHIVNYPTPINLSYLWGFGFTAGIFLVIQILTGLFLAMYYVPTVELAFNSVEYIMREVNYGWLLRYLHANGASFFFIAVFLHISRSMYYQSYYLLPGAWITGVLILLLMMGTAFMGYVLPYGQMSYWGATVITNFVGVIPVFGKHIVEWLWGGFCVDHPTLHRFFSIHFLLPFVIVGLIFAHLIFLHVKGSSNPLGIHPMRDFVSFHPYFTVKDIFGLFSFLLPYLFVVFFFPNLLGHPDNYVPANPMVTPLHIVPEWYFLPFYAILRCTENKVAGIIHMLVALLGLLVLPWWPWKIYSFINLSLKSVLPKLHDSIKKFVMSNPSLLLIKDSFSYNGQVGIVHNPDFRPIFKFAVYLFFVNFVVLGAMGSQPPVEPYVTISRISMLYYFYFFIVALPFFHGLENLLWSVYSKIDKTK